MNANEFATWLREEIEKLHDKLDAVQEIQGEIRTVQAEQAKDISHHIRRTDVMEARIEQVATELEPVETHVKQIRAVGWFIGVCAAAVGVAATLWQLFTAN